MKITRDAIDVFRADTGAYPAGLTDLAATTAPTAGLDTLAASKTIASTDWRGPYLQAVVTDPTDGGAFGYSTTSGSVGKVTAHNTGTASDGTAYSTW